MIKPGQRKKRRRREGGEGAVLPPPPRCPPGFGPNKNLETVANSRPVAICPSAGLRAGAGVTEWGSQHAAWSWGWGEQVVGGPGRVAPSALALGRAGQALTAERQPLSSWMMALKPRKPVTMTRAPAKMRM